MKESASIAYEYLKSHSLKLGIEPTVFENWNVHIHIPEGATPKDGPSAGITMFTALASAFTQRKLKKGIAMTGEITLRGRVLPIGGLKEKLLAAHRGDIHTVIIPKDNEKDLADVPANILKSMEIIFVEHVDEVLKVALLPEEVAEAGTAGEKKDLPMVTNVASTSNSSFGPTLQII